jgi:predicted DCC family thiol-disulfide oxidoreductase YuxK
LVFDGDCGFCTTSANWIEARWPKGCGASIVASQSLSADDLAGWGLRTEDVQRAAWWIDERGPHEGAGAVAHALMAANGFWGFVGRSLIVPPLAWVARSGYRLVARYRYRLPGSTPACKV